MARGTLPQTPEEFLAPPPSDASDVGNPGSDLDCCTSVAEVRVRSAEQLGGTPWDSSVNSSYHGSPQQMQLFVDLHRSDPEACHRLADAVTALPEVGTELLGFRLLAELGHGAF